MTCPLTWVFCQVLIGDDLVLPALDGSFCGLHTKLYPVSERKTAAGSNIRPSLCLMCHMFALQWAFPGIWTDLVLCADWQKQQKDSNLGGHGVEEKPRVVNTISADFAGRFTHPSDSWGELKRKLCSNSERQGFHSAALILGKQNSQRWKYHFGL